MLKKLLTDVLTENDGSSYCIGRVTLVVSTAMGMPTLCLGALYSIYSAPDHHFDMQSFGIAFAAVLAGISAAIVSIAQKQKTDTSATQ